ncbi:MAG TPA: hypothetical protein VFA29_14485, partial [Candidatus Baltobacteraceae bacterium]|nr:hypothetical protein [Candidatus Baltobacteraceae bacterium]
LVDHDSGAPLAGVAVGLAPWVAGATPLPQGTTDPNGKFAVAASPGEYLLVIGSDRASDLQQRATIHDAIVLAAAPPTQVLAAPTMPPVPSTTPNPIERSGNFRLMTMNADEQACLAYENQKRASLGYSPAIEDEWLAENQRMAVQQEINGGGVGGGGLLTNYNGFAGGGCVQMIDNDYTVVTNMGNPKIIWYGSDEINAGAGAVDEGMLDPRAPLPFPTPSVPWP